MPLLPLPPLRPALAFLLPAAVAVAQTAPAGPGPARETVTLSPFEVRLDDDQGYTATNTLAGSRLNTELRNTPAAITVFTKEFLEDIGALNTMEALAYSLNAGREFTDYTGLAATQQSDGAVQSRGFVGASLGRNYFVSRVSLDAFNTERMDFARGPNSILYGIGGPGGIINTSTKRALLGGRPIQQVQARIGSWDDRRVTVDAGRSLGRTLALRANAAWQDRDGWRDFEHFRLKAGALAATVRPFAHTELRVEGEYGDRHQVVPYPYPSSDFSSAWLAAGRPVTPGTGAVTGTAANGSRVLVYDPLGGSGLMAWNGTQQTTKGPTSPSLAQPVVFRDFTVLPKRSNLGGPGNNSDNWYGTYSAFLNQEIAGLNLELAYNRMINSHLLEKAIDWNQLGAFGDPNAFLPSNPLPNGTLPAAAGRPNPNAGRLYVNGQAVKVYQHNDTHNWRLTGAYELNLNRRRLGLHRFAFLASREVNYGLNDVLREVITNPPGTANYPLDLSNANNAVLRRTYLDFNGGDRRLRGALDPREFPIQNLNGITTGFRRTADQSAVTITETEARMLAGQSQLLGDRLFATWGLRRDHQQVDTSGNATRDPVTREFSFRVARVSTAEFAGNTRTVGLVARPLPWLGLVFNAADNFVPQTPTDVRGLPVGARLGKGQDVGVKLALLENRVNLTLSRYRLEEQNRAADNAAVTVSLTPAANEIWEALNRPDKVVPANRDSVDNVGSGWELELTANPTPQWRVSFNANRAEIQQTHSLPRWFSYIAENRAAWLRTGTVPLIAPFTGITSGGNAPTVADAVASLDRALAAITAAEGHMPRQHRRGSANVFTTYTLRQSGAWYDQLTFGGGGNWRSRPVTGYDTVTGDHVFGGESVLVNAMVQKTWKLRRGTLRAQLNVDNLLDFDDFIITDKDNTGTYRVLFQQPRRWALSLTRSF